MCIRDRLTDERENPEFDSRQTRDEVLAPGRDPTDAVGIAALGDEEYLCLLYTSVRGTAVSKMPLARSPYAQTLTTNAAVTGLVERTPNTWSCLLYTSRCV